MSMFKDPMFFYAVAFVIFMALAYKFARKPMMSWLDAEIIKIRDELEEAQRLRNEAEATLADYKQKQMAAMTEAEGIVAYARDEAARLKEQAEIDLRTSLARHEQQAMDRIRAAEAEASAEVRAAAVDLALQMARQAFATQLDEAAANKLVDQAIAELPAGNAKKAEAA